jgi:DNA-binding MarR family transcriptional regulator
MTKPQEAKTEYPLGDALDFLQRLWQLNHALEKLSSRMEKSIGVSAQQRLVIRCIGKYPGMSAGQLAALLHVDPGTVSAALKRLEEKGLLKRRRDPRDNRRVVLALTAKGRALDVPVEGTVEGAVARLLQSASDADVAATSSMLSRLTSLLGDELRE